VNRAHPARLLFCGAALELLLKLPRFCGADCGAAWGVKRRKLLLPFCWLRAAGSALGLTRCTLRFTTPPEAAGAPVPKLRKLDRLDCGCTDRGAAFWRGCGVCRTTGAEFWRPGLPRDCAAGAAVPKLRKLDRFACGWLDRGAVFWRVC